MFSTALYLLMYSLAGNRNFARKNYISQPLPPMPFSSPEAALLLVSTKNRDLPLARSNTGSLTPECRWTGPEVAILGADQKERGLWGRECSNVGHLIGHLILGLNSGAVPRIGLRPVAPAPFGSCLFSRYLVMCGTQ